VDGGGCLLALSKVLACYGFESSEFWCASEFDVNYVVLESQTVVVGDFYPIGVRDGCEVVMIVFWFVIRVAVDFSGATSSLLIVSHVCSVFM